MRKAWRRWLRWCGVFTALAITAVPASMGMLSLGLDNQNRLARHREWQATKLTINRHLTGSHRFSQGTQALAGNRIDLSLWNGCNEIVYKTPVTLKRLTFQFRLSPGAVLYVTPGQPGLPPPPYLQYAL